MFDISPIKFFHFWNLSVFPTGSPLQHHSITLQLFGNTEQLGEDDGCFSSRNNHLNYPVSVQKHKLFIDVSFATMKECGSQIGYCNDIHDGKRGNRTNKVTEGYGIHL